MHNQHTLLPAGCLPTPGAYVYYYFEHILLACTTCTQYLAVGPKERPSPVVGPPVAVHVNHVNIRGPLRDSFFEHFERLEEWKEEEK